MWSGHERVEAILTKICELARAADFIVEVGAEDVRLPVAIHQRTGLRVLTQHTHEDAAIERSEAAAKRPGASFRSTFTGGRPLVILSSLDPLDLFVWASALPEGGTLFMPDFDPGRVPNLTIVSCTTDVSATGVLITRVPRVLTETHEQLERSWPRRPLRSVFLGYLGYASIYALGVAQGMAAANAWHRTVSITDGIDVIDRAVREMKPDLIWTHMFLWPPRAAPPLYALLECAERWRKAGAVVLVHDGDPRLQPRFDHNVSVAVDLALCNHSCDRSGWGVPTLRWPYAALAQSEIAEPDEAYRAELIFAGTLRDVDDRDDYAGRSRFVASLAERLGDRMRIITPEDGNNRMLLAEIAPACTAMIGCGRQDVPGWVDTRVFTVPGAGGLLIHDDVAGAFEPGVHYLPYTTGSVDSVVEALERARLDAETGGLIRQAGFRHAQTHHSYPARVREVLARIYRGVAP